MHHHGSQQERIAADERDNIILQQLASIFEDDSNPNELHSTYFNAYPWHSHTLLDNPVRGDETANTWRLKRKTNSVGVALVVCLNIGTDPPDIFKPANCARKECWFDPLSVPKTKALENIGNALQRQYEKWQAKAKYKLCLDPTSDDLRRVCINLRKAARTDRLLLHYNGHGVPRPTENGELWVFGKHYSHYMPVPVSDMRSWLGDPSIYVLDCSGAGALMPYFIDDQHTHSQHTSQGLSSPRGEGTTTSSSQSNHKPHAPSMSNLEAQADSKCIVLASCNADEILPLNPVC